MTSKYSYNRQGTSRILTTPGLHSYDIKAGPLGLTLDVDVPESYEMQRRAAITYIVVDADVDTDLLDEYEDSILRAASRTLGKSVCWSEGEWGRTYGNTRRRMLAL